MRQRLEELVAALPPGEEKAPVRIDRAVEELDAVVVRTGPGGRLRESEARDGNLVRRVFCALTLEQRTCGRRRRGEDAQVSKMDPKVGLVQLAGVAVLKPQAPDL